ncbi:hypothetical protein R1flu_024739 [Riccia fluitans]|uniref:Uncharacterized protein n=1 Tax=Riccia fluitans TaxID=41844 RepID=A0ABD1XVX4_9MARC
MLRVMGETKDELLGGPGPAKRRIPPVEEDGDVGKLFSEWRLVGRTLRPIDNNVVSALAQNAKGDNQFFEPLVYPAANENAKADHHFFEPLVPFSTNEHPEPTKPSLVADSIRPSVTHANMKKNHGSETEVASFLNEQSGAAKSVMTGDSAVSHHHKENPILDPSVLRDANEVAETVSSTSRNVEETPQKLDGCQVEDTRSPMDSVTLKNMPPERKEIRKFIEKREMVVRSKGGSVRSDDEDTAPSDASITSSDTLTTEEEDNAGGGQGRGKRTSEEYLREERIRKAAIEAGVSYYHDGVVFRENIVYDMLRSPSSGTQEDMLETNHDLEEEYRKPAQRKKLYNPELFSLSNDHFLEAFEKTLAELDPKDTIEQETFASVTRQSGATEPEHFHQFNFASLNSLVNLRLEDENLLDFNSLPEIAPASTTTSAATDQATADPHVSLGNSSSFLSDSSKEVNQFLLDEEALPESGEEVKQFFLEGDSLPESRDDVKQVSDVEHSLKNDPSFTNSVLVPNTPDQGAEVNPPPRKEHIATPPRGLVVESIDDTNNESALESPAQAVSLGEGVIATPTPSTENSDAAALRRISADVTVSVNNVQDDQNQRPRSKTINDFFSPSEMTLRRPSTIEIKKRDKETRNLLRAVEQRAIAEAAPVDHLRFALPPPSSRGTSRRHSLSDRSLEIAGLALTPIKVLSRDGACDHSHGSCSHCCQGAPKRRAESSSRAFGVSGGKSPQVESSTSQRKNGEASGVAGNQSPYSKLQAGYLKRGGGGVPSPSSSVASSKTPHTPQSTTSSGSEASPKQNPFKRSSGIYSSLVQRDKRSGDVPSVLLNTSRLSTSVNLPSFSRMSTSVNLPSAGERSSNQRQGSTRSSTECLHPPGMQKKSPMLEIKKAADRIISRPAPQKTVLHDDGQILTADDPKQQQPTLRSTDPYAVALSAEFVLPSEDLCKISTGYRSVRI